MSPLGARCTWPWRAVRPWLGCPAVCGMCGYQGPGAVSRKAGPDTMPVLHSLLASSISLCVRIKDGHSPGWLFPSHLTDGLHSLQAIRDTTRKAVEKLSLFPGEVQQEEEVAVSVPGRGSSQGAGRGGRVCPWQREPAEDWACLFFICTDHQICTAHQRCLHLKVLCSFPDT